MESGGGDEESLRRRWDELNPDILGLIFNNLELKQLLTVVPRVCKNWHRTVEGPHCWQVIDMGLWSLRCRIPQHLDRMIRMLINRSSGSLRELRVNKVDNEETISFIAENAGSLHTLSFNLSKISDLTGEQVAKRLSNLVSLNLSNCHNISTLTLESVGRNCKFLSSLTLRMFLPEESSRSRVDEARAIAQNMPRLKQLDIAYLNVDTPDVLNIIKGCPELELLNLAGCQKVVLDEVDLLEKHPGLKVVRSIQARPYDPESSNGPGNAYDLMEEEDDGLKVLTFDDSDSSDDDDSMEEEEDDGLEVLSSDDPESSDDPDDDSMEEDDDELEVSSSDDPDDDSMEEEEDDELEVSSSDDPESLDDDPDDYDDSDDYDDE